MLDTIAFIGAGVMGEAMIGGLLEKNLIAPERIIASAPRARRRDELIARYRVCTTADNAEAAHASSTVVLCVKPQMLARVLSQIHGHVGAEQLVISIAAGGRIAEPDERRRTHDDDRDED